jgi:hypothetical protein
MKDIIKKNYKQFLFRGCLSMGGGPLVLAIIYAVLQLCGVDVMLNGYEVALGIVTITALAFMAGGITVVYQIEEIPLSYGITAHGIVLYIVYAVVYLVNGWLKSGAIPFIVFTVIFILGYIITWGIIYLVTRKSTEKINKRLQNK